MPGPPTYSQHITRAYHEWHSAAVPQRQAPEGLLGVLDH